MAPKLVKKMINLMEIPSSLGRNMHMCPNTTYAWTTEDYAPFPAAFFSPEEILCSALFLALLDPDSAF